MTKVTGTPDAPPACPECGQPATAVTTRHDGKSHTIDCLDIEGHIWQTKWFSQGAAA